MVVFGVLAAASSAAAADKRKEGEWAPEALRTDLGIDIGVWGAKGSTAATSTGLTTSLPPSVTMTSMPFVIFGHNEVVPNLVLDLYVPFTIAFASDPVFSENGDDAKAAGGIGNPTLVVRYAKQRNAVTWTIGGGLGAPLGALKSTKLREADLLAGSAMALTQNYLWATPFMPILATVGVEVRPIPKLAIRGSLEPAFFIPLEGGLVGLNTVHIDVYERIEAEFRAKNGFCAGLSFYGTTGIPNSGSPQEQLSLKPFIGYDDADSFFIRGGALLALNSPLGVGFSQGKVLTGIVSVGGYLGGGSSDDDD